MTKISIIGGAGAVGSYFTHMFQQAREEVVGIGRDTSEHFQAVKREGLIVKTSQVAKTLKLEQKLFTDKLPADGTQDAVIISIKQPDLSSSLIDDVLKSIHSKSTMAIISNGLPFYFLTGLNIPGKKYLEAVDPNGELQQKTQNNNIVGILPLIAASIE
jgi:ketopantoate reductase